jgi:hypothetical protein
VVKCSSQSVPQSTSFLGNKVSIYVRCKSYELVNVGKSQVACLSQVASYKYLGGYGKSFPCQELNQTFLVYSLTWCCKGNRNTDLQFVKSAYTKDCPHLESVLVSDACCLRAGLVEVEGEFGSCELEQQSEVLRYGMFPDGLLGLLAGIASLTGLSGPGTRPDPSFSKDTGP